MSILIAVISGGVVSAIVSGLFSVVLWRLNRKAAKEDKGDDIKCGLRMILYVEIKRLGKECIARGNIHTEELEDLIAMHKVYHDKLGGNGFLDNLMAQVKRLQIVE